MTALVRTNPLSKMTMDFLMRMKDFEIARADQEGGLPVGKSGYILDTDLNLNNDKYKGRMIRITDPKQKIEGFDINMLIMVDDMERDDRKTAKMAMFASFWDLENDWSHCLYDEQQQSDIEFAVFIGMLSQWASPYVYDALIATFEKDDPKQLKYYLPVLTFGYLNQYSNYFHLKESEPMNQALEDLSYFVDKHCSPFIQERYARLMAERQERRSKRAKTHGVASD